MSSTLAGRAALVTGSTAGIGEAIAYALAQAGAEVVVSGRDADRGAAVVESISSAGGAAHFVPVDLAAGAPAVQRLAAETLDAVGGRLDILVNNAAMLLMPRPTTEVEAATIAAAFTVSVHAPFLLTGLLAPAMAARGDGVIVNIGSINGLVGMANSALYSSTKAAIHSLTKSWAAEYGPSGVRVNTVAPGPTATARNAEIAEHLAPILATMPSRRLGTLAEVASAVVYLAGDSAANFHGSTLTVDGGFTAL
ncbi:SDR family oxidoreductase [Jatrophihabitans sp.]|uniref:SDR family NAD(P)-dependent oxidoreductase n=1 Tax=Jatrophihabitans sp. TaxID=1932789 RepID=UPI0030C6EC24|nr:putative oxidoreductase [Jatrophihabitans sp.]